MASVNLFASLTHWQALSANEIIVAVFRAEQFEVLKQSQASSIVEDSTWPNYKVAISRSIRLQSAEV